VTDVMVNGKWLLKEHELLTMNEKELMLSAAKYAEKIDTFLQEREQSVLSKLVAIGGALQEESFEVQAKVRINDPEPILSAINNPEIEILHTRHYHEYDTYFLFTDKNQGTYAIGKTNL
jgi:5-methylthioadenosine/S-adenosylhomocysteine deaminase